MTETVTYTLSYLANTSFVVSASWSGQYVQTASGGNWVKAASLTCDGCTSTTTFSGQGTLTADGTTYLVTSASGDYAQSNIGRPITSMVNPVAVAKGTPVGVWWIDQNNNYSPVSVTKSSEKLIGVGTSTAKTAALTHTGTSVGYWEASNTWSSGPETDTWYFDESTGVLIEYDASGTYTFTNGSGGWTETLQENDIVSSTTLNLGDYVVFGSNPPTDLTVDGSPVSASSQPFLFVWSWGSSHTISAPSTVDLSAGARLIFRSWDDGTQNATRTVTASQPAQYQADYKKQYLLTITSPYGTPVGGGWYDEGSTANVHIDSGYLFWDFAGWSGYSLPSSPDAQLTMTGPVTLQANWTIDFIRVALLILAIVGIAAGFLYYRRRASPTRRDEFPASVVPVSRTFCASCGAEIAVGSRFCRKCGAAQG